jgi:hypothetical protein
MIQLLSIKILTNKIHQCGESSIVCSILLNLDLYSQQLSQGGFQLDALMDMLLDHRRSQHRDLEAEYFSNQEPRGEYHVLGGLGIHKKPAISLLSTQSLNSQALSTGCVFNRLDVNSQKLIILYDYPILDPHCGMYLASYYVCQLVRLLKVAGSRYSYRVELRRNTSIPPFFNRYERNTNEDEFHVYSSMTESIVIQFGILVPEIYIPIYMISESS